MDRGLTVKWNDRLHPSQAHFVSMRKLGVPLENIPLLESFTSDILKVSNFKNHPVAIKKVISM